MGRDKLPDNASGTLKIDDPGSDKALRGRVSMMDGLSIRG